MNDLVSIITPCYNCASFIAQAIDSVLAQSYQQWEMIIVNDGSTDTSSEIIAPYAAKDSRIKLIPLGENQGVAKARNVAIKTATGRYIAFLDADDLWLSNKLKQQLSFMQVNNLAFTYASYQLINEYNERLGEFITKASMTYYDLLKTCSIGCLTAIYDTQKLGKMYVPDTLIRGDYALWLKILKNIHTAQGIIQPLAIYRINTNSLSANKLKAGVYQWRVYRQNEQLSWFKSAYYFLHYMYYGLVKYK